MYKHAWYCRWCGKQTKPQKSERDGFCDNGGKCKQAHHRAYHKYLNGVTAKVSAGNSRAPSSNAAKTKKRKGKP